MEYPKQRVSKATKYKLEGKIPVWFHDNAEYFSNYASNYAHLISEMDDLLDVAAGEFDKSSLRYVENPFNTDKPEYQRYPAKLRNYDIITPIIERHLGERRDMPDTIQIRALNYKDSNEYKAAKQQYFKTKLQEQFIAELQAMMQGGKPIEDIDLSALDHQFNTTWATRKAIKGQRLYEWIKGQKHLTEKEQELYYYWLAVGRIATYKSGDHGDIEYTVMDPRTVTPVHFGNTKNYEDCAAVRAVHMMSVASILDTWGDKLSETDKQLLERHYDRSGYEDAIVYRDRHFTTLGGNMVKQETDLIEVEHIVWKSQDQRRILFYRDQFGFEQRIEVDEDYVFEPELGDIRIEERWENCWYYTWRIPELYTVGDKLITAIYLDYGKGKPQRNEVNNTSICKLPYNGTFRGLDYGVIKSVVKSGIPYNMLYSIFLYRFELTLAKNKDKVLLFPIGLIPKMKGWDVDKFMYNIHAFSIAFFNEKEDKAIAALQAIKEIDLSLSQYMADMWKFMQAIKEEWRDAAGFSPQRYGQIGTEAGKATTQEAIYRSAVSSKEMIGQFDHFYSLEVAGLIDHAKVAYPYGMQGQYVINGGDVVEFDLSEQDIQETEYGIFASNSATEYEKLQQLKSWVPHLLQNGASHAIAGKILDEENSHRVIALLEQGDALQKKHEQALADKESEAMRYVADLKAKSDQEANATRIRVAEIAADARVEGNLIMSDSFNAPLGDADNDGVSESEEIEQRSFERRMRQQQLSQQAHAQTSKEQLEREKLSLDRAKIATQYAIAKENKNRYDS